MLSVLDHNIGHRGQGTGPVRRACTRGECLVEREQQNVCAPAVVVDITKKYVAKGNLDLSSRAWEAGCARTRGYLLVQTVKKYCCCTFRTHKQTQKEAKLNERAQNRTPSMCEYVQQIQTSDSKNLVLVHIMLV